MNKLIGILRPRCLIGICFIFPARTRNVKLHRHLIGRVMPHRQRWQWHGLLGLIILYWYGYQGWRELISVIRKLIKDKSISAKESHVMMFLDLLTLAFYLGVSPSAYVTLRLFRHPRSDWLDFIFPQELPDWHVVFSESNSESVRLLLRDKYEFAKCLGKEKIPHIETIRKVPIGNTLLKHELFIGEEFFIKPNASSAMRGCVRLSYRNSNREYQLTGKDLRGNKVSATQQNEILEQLNNMLAKQDFLLQPLLRNHKELVELYDTEELMTVRVVTAKTQMGFCIVHACLEIPNDLGQFFIVGIDSATGVFLGEESLPAYLADKEYFKCYEQLCCKLNRKNMPFWFELAHMTESAHQCMDSLPTIGWDLAVSANGPLIVEGNAGWGVIQSQAIGFKPLLKSQLAEYYLQYLQ